MTDFKFDGVDKLKRNREIEGETGAELGIGDVTLIVLAATDANPRWKQFGDEYSKELRRLAKANAGEARTKKFLATWFTRLFIKDWRGVTSDKVEVPFGREACEAWLMETDDVIPAVREMVFETQNFRGARVEAIVENAKNS